MDRQDFLIPLTIAIILVLLFLARKKLAPLAARYYYYRSQRYSNRGLFWPAIKSMEKAIQLDSSKKQYPLGMANIYLTLRDMDAALEYARLAKELDGDDYGVHILKGDLYYQSGNLEKALENYLKAAEANVDRGFSYSKVGEILYKTEQPEEALKAFDEGLSKSNGDIYLLNYKGFMLYELDRHREAIDCFNQVLQKDPHNLYALFFKGKTLQDMGELLLAKEIFIHLINIESEYTAYAHLALGDLYRHLEEFSGAEVQFRKYIKLNPDDPRGYMDLGLVFVETGRPAEAIELYQIAINMEPSTEGYLGIGQGYMQLAQPEEAIKYFKKAISFNPLEPHIYQEMAYCLESLSRHQEAAVYYEKAKALTVTRKNPCS